MQNVDNAFLERVVSFARALRAENPVLHSICQRDVNDRAFAIGKLAEAKVKDCVQRCKGKTPVQYVDEMLLGQMCRTRTYRELVHAICFEVVNAS